MRPGAFRAVTPPPVGKLERDSVRLGVCRFAEADVTWLGTFPGYTWLGYALPPGGIVKHSLIRFDFGPSIVYAASSDRIWIGDSETGDIRMFDTRGEQVAVTRAPVMARELSRSALDRARARALEFARNAGVEARITAVYASAREQRYAPLFTRFVAGPNGEVSIEGFQEVDMSSKSVVVLDRAGMPIATVELPARTRLLEVGANYILGVQIRPLAVPRAKGTGGRAISAVHSQPR